MNINEFFVDQVVKEKSKEYNQWCKSKLIISIRDVKRHNL